MRKHPKLERKFAKANILLALDNPDSRKRYKAMSEHSYGRTKHNLDGFWNGTSKAGRKTKPNKFCHSPKGITTIAKLEGSFYRPYDKQG